MQTSSTIWRKLWMLVLLVPVKLHWFAQVNYLHSLCLTTHTHTHLESLGLLYLPATYISQLSAYYSYAAFAFSIHIHTDTIHACLHAHASTQRKSQSVIPPFCAHVYRNIHTKLQFIHFLSTLVSLLTVLTATSQCVPHLCRIFTIKLLHHDH